MAVRLLEAPSFQPSKYSYSKGIYKSTYEWKIAVDEVRDDFVDVLPEAVAVAAAGWLPFEGTLHPYIPLAYCDSTECQHVKGSEYVYRATFTNANSDRARNKPGKTENPLDDLPLIRPRVGMRKVARHKDIEEKAVMTSSREPLVYETERQTLGFTIKSNVVALPFWIYDLVDSKSGSDIIIYGHPIPSGQARFILPDDFISDPLSRNGYSYFEFKFEIRVDWELEHDQELLDAGFYEWLLNEDTGEFEKVRIVGAKGDEINEPEPLRDGERIPEPSPDNVDFIKVKQYREANYGALPGVQSA